MTPATFSAYVERRLRLVQQVLVDKGEEYGRERDGDGGRFHNFHRAGAMLGCTPEKALIGHLSKHLVSIVDLVDDLDHGMTAPRAMWEEKIGDAICYLLLLDALVLENRRNA